MIVRMKEILLFTTANVVDETVQKLAEFGVVDIKEVKIPNSESIERYKIEIKETNEAIQILKDHELSENGGSQMFDANGKDPKTLVRRLLKSRVVKQNIQKSIIEINEKLTFYKIWGDNFNQKDLNLLENKGIYVRLYYIDKALLKTLPDDKEIVAFDEYENKIPIALFSEYKNEKLIYKEEGIPKLSNANLLDIKARKIRQYNQLTVFLDEYKNYQTTLESYEHLLQNRLASETAIDGMGDIQSKVKYLRGFIPRDEVSKFKKIADHEVWGYDIKEPTNMDEVPVYIKNPKWISIINPMMKFIDIVPGYKEIDVSIYFLIAFALFFAMLVGDAGYGFIFLALAIVFRKKMTPQLRTLIYVLSGSTIIWGVLSGTYFGAEQIAQLPFLKDFVIPYISSFGVDNVNFMMFLSFLIGAVHLTVAHGIRFYQFINSIKALSEVGWILMIWGLFFVTGKLVLGDPPPIGYHWLFIVGTTLVVLFSEESNNFFKSMGASIANLPLSLISGFSDIVSYVRLFAVGMATAAVAASFNNMILPDGIIGMGYFGISYGSYCFTFRTYFKHCFSLNGSNGSRYSFKHVGICWAFGSTVFWRSLQTI